jgi:hypothetical protein
MRRIILTTFVVLLTVLFGRAGLAQDEPVPPAMPQAADPFAPIKKKIVKGACEEIEGSGSRIIATALAVIGGSCESFLDEALKDGGLDSGLFLEGVKDTLTNPENLNSALNSAFGGGKVPLNLKFKVFDTDNGDPSLGVEYSFSKKIKDIGYGSSGKWRKGFAFNLHADGNVAFEAKENPNDFLQTSLSFGLYRVTALPEQSLDFGTMLTERALAAAACTDLSVAACPAFAEAVDLVENTAVGIPNILTYMEFGLDVGIETDQKFDSTQYAFGTYFGIQFDDWGNNSFLGVLKVFPAFRLSADRVDPNAKTPRSLLGDTSSYFRLGGEVSIRTEVARWEGAPLYLTGNFRYYKELNPSELVKTAGLDDFSLATFSLSGPNGIFVSYSTGELPMDADRDNVVEIGWKTYF